MAAYAIIESEVTDRVVFDDFLGQVPAFVQAHGGKYLVRAGATEVVQGDWIPRRLAVVEFDSLEKARAWQYSPDYAELRAMLNRSSRTNVVLVEGV